MAGKKARIYKLTAKQATKARSLYRSGRGATTKKAMQAGLKKAKMPASGQAIINFLRGAKTAKGVKGHKQVASVFNREVYAYMHKHKVGLAEGRTVIMKKPKWKKPREKRQAVKGLRGRVRAQKQKRIEGATGESKAWALYYDVGIYPGSPPFEYTDAEAFEEGGGKWEGQTRYIHEHPEKPSAATKELYIRKVTDKYEPKGMPTRNFQLMHIKVSKKQAKVNNKRRADVKRAAEKKRMEKINSIKKQGKKGKG